MKTKGRRGGSDPKPDKAKSEDPHAIKTAAAEESAAPNEHQVIEADVDGRRVRIQAKDEIVLECGKASITLRRNGKVIVRGLEIETRAEGTNRIKGGHVRLN